MGELPLIYNGNLDIITNKIEDLKKNYPTHYHYLDSYLKENLKYFINNALYYSKYPKLVRSNSILENYNRHLKEKLGKNKTVNFINFLSFIKKEDEIYFKEFNAKSRNYREILKYKGKNKKSGINIEEDNEEQEESISENFIQEDIIIDEDCNHNKGEWLIWNNNSCRFDVLMTIYLFLFFQSNEEKNQNLINEGLKILHDTIKKLIDNPSSEDRYDFWSYININQIDRGEHKLEFGEMGFISGLFKLFDNNELYCLKIKKKLCVIHVLKLKKIYIIINA